MEFAGEPEAAEPFSHTNPVSAVHGTSFIGNGFKLTPLFPRICVHPIFMLSIPYWPSGLGEPAAVMKVNVTHLVYARIGMDVVTCCLSNMVGLTGGRGVQRR